MESSRSSSNEQAEVNETTRRIAKFESSSVLFSPASPFALPFLRPLMADVPRVVQVMQKSVISTADRCAEIAQSLIDSNPLLRRFASVSSEVREFCCQVQIRSRHSQNVSFPLNNCNFAAILPGDSVAGMVVTNGILNFLNIYNTILVCRLVLTWFPNAPPAIVGPLSTLCDPYLNIFRGLIPPLGGTLDLSPILAFLVLNAFTSTASALPAELPPSMRAQEGHVLQENLSTLTTSQEKWRRRFTRDKSNNNGGINN